MGFVSFGLDAGGGYWFVVFRPVVLSYFLPIVPSVVFTSIQSGFPGWLGAAYFTGKKRDGL